MLSQRSSQFEKQYVGQDVNFRTFHLDRSSQDRRNICFVFFYLLFRFGLLIRDISDVYCVLWYVVRWRILFVHVATGDGQNGPIIGEREAGNGGGVAVELTQTLFVVTVPDVNIPITAACGECVVVFVEGDGVDRVDVFNAILSNSVTFKSVFFLLCFWARIQILHRHPTLYGAENVARLVREAPETPRLILQTRLSLLLYVAHISEVPHPH